MNHNRQRLAWAVLLVSFALCLGLAIGTPVGARYVVRTACEDQKASLEPQQGTPRVQRRGRGQVFALIGPTWDVPPGTVVATDSASQGLLTLYTSDQEPEVIATIQIYGDTEVVLESARTPRFEVSPLPHRIWLRVNTPTLISQGSEEVWQEGRVRINVASAVDRPTVLTLRTPYLTALLQEGSYEVRVHPANSELSVIEGQAEVRIPTGESVVLGTSERTVAQAGVSALEVLSGERNLLKNGDFSRPLETGWTSYHEEDEPPPALVEGAAFAGRSAARFYRAGSGHAEVGIWQGVNYDVRDFTSLVLRLAVNVVSENVAGWGGCGYLSSECPIIVRIDYKDIYGTDRYWLHGFYIGEPHPEWRLEGWAEPVPPQTWYAFDSGNLLDPQNPIGALDQAPALIKEVRIYASGHSFEALVTEVELLVRE